MDKYSVRINLSDIDTQSIHNHTVFKKPLITQDEKNGQLATCNWAWLEKGMQAEQHSHPDGLEYFLFLEGEGKMLLGEEWLLVKKEDLVTVPQNTIHSIKNTGEEKLVFITLRTIVK